MEVEILKRGTRKAKGTKNLKTKNKTVGPIGSLYVGGISFKLSFLLIFLPNLRLEHE